ncbi:hypothetical protein FACS1894130_12060 [Spirochaetia bacterium]|nr:hypothetical protein FACS1894130_12060 [Spirochaetia bacterium]
MEYKFAGSISLNDYIRFNRFHAKNTAWNKKYKWIFYTVFFVTAAIILVPRIKYLLSLDKKILIGSIIATKNILIIILVIGIGVILLWMLLRFVWLSSIYKSHYNSNKMLGELTNYTVTEDTILSNSESGNSVSKKTVIYKIEFDYDNKKNAYPYAIYIYIAKTLALMINKNFFSNVTEYMKFVEFVKNNYCK